MCVFFVDARGAHKLVSAQKHTHHTSRITCTLHSSHLLQKLITEPLPNNPLQQLWNGREGNIVKSGRCKVFKIFEFGEMFFHIVNHFRLFDDVCH